MDLTVSCLREGSGSPTRIDGRTPVMLGVSSAHWMCGRNFPRKGGCGRSVMSIARLSAGAGYRYLLRHTAAGDAARPQSTSLVDYYAATGYPPGRWLGSGLGGLNDVAGPMPGYSTFTVTSTFVGLAFSDRVTWVPMANC
jgi:hypothetical protein